VRCKGNYRHSVAIVGEDECRRRAIGGWIHERGGAGDYTERLHESSTATLVEIERAYLLDVWTERHPGKPALQRAGRRQGSPLRSPPGDLGAPPDEPAAAVVALAVAAGDERLRGRRIFILGAAGSGKTTLARKVAGELNVDPVELDLDPFADRAALAAGEEWVVEGIFLYDVEPLLERATTIVWLDLPRRVAQRRIITRHVKLSVLRRNRYKGIRQLVRFARGMRHYYVKPAREPRAADDWDALSRALTVKRLARHTEKVVHLRKPRGVRTFVRRFR
jgi:adenylate kinase family enzyme